MLALHDKSVYLNLKNNVFNISLHWPMNKCHACKREFSSLLYVFCEGIFKIFTHELKYYLKFVNKTLIISEKIILITTIKTQLLARKIIIMCFLKLKYLFEFKKFKTAWHVFMNILFNISKNESSRVIVPYCLGQIK